VRIGTRGSALALAQARQVADALGGAELVPITTSGDRAAGTDKERWVKEIDSALLRGEIDFAVHSAKDVPARLGEGLEIAATPARADPRDALCGAASLDGLRQGARVGTSSLRREALLRAHRPDLEVVALRGNVDTRLRRLQEDGLDAIVLAYAGLQRLGRTGAAGAVLDPGEIVPAAGQGTLILTARAGDDAVRACRRDRRPRDGRCTGGRAGARARPGRRLPHPGRRARGAGRGRGAAAAGVRRARGRERLGPRRAARPRPRGARRRGGPAPARRGR